MKSMPPCALTAWAALFLAAAMLTACSDSDDEPRPGEEEYTEMTAEDEMHYCLLRTFYNVNGNEEYEPKMGRVRDEAKQSERSLACESYELALKDFEENLPSTENSGSFINRDSNGITVSLGSLGNVKFSPASGDGVVAKAEISLKGAPAYTVLYRLASSLGDNFLDFRDQYFPGDYVSFTCNYPSYNGSFDGSFKTDGHWENCGTRTDGIVIEVAADRMYVLTCHCHEKLYEDHWKRAYISYNCTTSGDWAKIYNSWHNYRDFFMDTYHVKKNYCWEIAILYDIMEGNPTHNYVCVYGDDYDLDHGIYSARNTVYSKTQRISIENIRKGNFDVGTTWYAYRKECKYPDCYYFMLQSIWESDDPRLLYPLN